MGNWIPAYNTNGFAHHRLADAICILSELGYGGIALTLDVHHLDPFAEGYSDEMEELRGLLEQQRMHVMIEAGARFNLDMRRKHFPSLMSRRERGLRIKFLHRCVQVAEDLGAVCVNTWSGHNFDGLPRDAAVELLVDGLADVMVMAEDRGVDIAFEPEPGMFIETLDGYSEVKERFPSPRFGLALDIGHLLVTGECEPQDALRRFRGDLISLTIEDMKRGVHEHLPFGEGDVDFPPFFAALHEIGYRGMVAVELSRSSATAPDTARAAMEFLEQY